MKLDRLLWAVGLCVAVYVGYKVAVFMLPPPKVNISREQYDQALAKWHAQDVREYEMVVNYELFNRALYGPWRLRVRLESGVEGIVAYSRPDGEGSPWHVIDNLQSLTVGSLFESAQDMLNSGPNELGFGGPKYYKASFDQALGYPIHLESHPRRLDVSDQDWSITVKSLTILKRGTPAATLTP